MRARKKETAKNRGPYRNRRVLFSRIVEMLMAQSETNRAMFLNVKQCFFVKGLIMLVIDDQLCELLISHSPDTHLINISQKTRYFLLKS